MERSKEQGPEGVAERTASELIADLETTEAIYRRLIDLAARQLAVIGEGPVEELVAIARTKESEMARLREVEARTRAMHDRWDAMRTGLDERTREAVRAAAGRVRSVLRELLEIEKAQEIEIQRRKDATVERIRRLHAGRKVASAYGAAPSSPGVVDTRE